MAVVFSREGETSYLESWFGVFFRCGWYYGVIRSLFIFGWFLAVGFSVLLVIKEIYGKGVRWEESWWSCVDCNCSEVLVFFGSADRRGFVFAFW